MRRLIYRDAALNDIADIIDYLCDVGASEATAEAFTDRLRERCRKLANLPGTMGRSRLELGSGVRSQPYKGYILFFRYLNNNLVVLRILEGHRDIEARFGDDDEG